MEEKYIKILLKLAKKAYKKNEVPISCILVKENTIISKSYNKKNIKNNPLLHAEIICLQKGYKKLKRWNLNDCVLYVTLEPCDMCRRIIEESRISNVYYVLEKGNVTNKYKKTKSSNNQQNTINKNTSESNAPKKTKKVVKKVKKIPKGE